MIQENYFALNVAVLAVGTLLIRGFFIGLSGRFAIGDDVRRLFSFFPAAIFPALVLPAVFYHRGSVEFLLGHERLAVLLVMVAATPFLRRTIWVILFGLALLYLVRFLA